MDTSFTKSDKLTDNFWLAYAAKTAGRGSQELALHPLLLISRIFFAVLVIGFIGYFFDQMMQSQKLNKILKIYRGM